MIVLGHLVRCTAVEPEKFNKGPSQKVHVDYDTEHAEQLIQKMLPDGEGVPKRWAAVNVCASIILHTTFNHLT